MKITKTRFLAYERVRRSGVTNMFDARRVQQRSGLSRPEIVEIMTNYDRLEQRYLRDRPKTSARKEARRDAA